MQISLYVQPGASKSEIVGIHNELLKIKIKAPPVDGKANQEVIRFFSEILGVPKGQIDLLKGEKSREKRILIRSLSLSKIKEILGF
ncbi:MAG: DUF167 domain-containing protein [Pseudobdellovibrionaceae bacterium]